MIPTILLDMPTNFVLGFLLMWMSRGEIMAENKTWTQPLKLAWLFSAFVFCPVTGWSFFAYPGWATVYLRPEFLIPAWTGPVIVSFYFLGMVFGTLLAQFLIQKRELKLFWICFALGLFWLVSTFVMTMDEYIHIGTYTAYHAGQAVLINEDAAFQRALNIMTGLIAGPGVGLIVYLHLRNKKFKTA